MPLVPPKPGKVTAYYLNNDLITSTITICEGELVFVEEGGINDTEFTVISQQGTVTVPVEVVKRDVFSSAGFPIHDAAKRGNLEMIEYCLDNKISVNALDKSGSTALYWSSLNGYDQVVKRLLFMENVSISSQNKMGDTPLHAAARKNHFETTKVLVEADADLYLINNDGQRPVDLATNPEIAGYLRLTMSEKPPPDAEDYASSSEDEA